MSTSAAIEFHGNTAKDSQEESLASRARSGLIWIAGLNILRDTLQFFVTIILVRLLDPGAYGQFSLVSSIMGFATVLSFRTVLEQTLQARPSENVDYQTLFTAGAFFQPALCLILNVVAFAMSRTSHYAETGSLLHVMSLFFLLDWASEFRVKMLERRLQWKQLRILQAIGVLLNASAAITLAWLGAGVYALLIPGLLVTFPFIVDLFIVGSWRPTWSFQSDGFLAAARYGVIRTFSGVALTGRTLLESSLLVQAIGFSSFGVYGRATGLATLACTKIPSLIAIALYPVLGKYSRDTLAYRRINGMVLRIVAWLVIPLSCFVFICASEIVTTLYGTKWAAAVPLMPWTLALGTCAGISQTLSLLLLGNVQQKRCLFADLLLLAGTLVSVVILLPLGLRWYLLGMLMCQISCILLMLRWLCQDGALDVAAVATSLIHPLPGVVLGTISSMWMMTVGGPVVLRLIATFTVFLGTYVAVLRFTSSTALREVVAQLPGRTHILRVLSWKEVAT